MTTSSSSAAIRCSQRGLSPVCVAAFTSTSPCVSCLSCQPSRAWRSISIFCATANSARTSYRSCRSIETQPLPLSFSQRRLWYLQKVDTNLSAYNIPAAFRVKGDLDSAALEQALNEMIARHEVLRSYVKEIDGQPRQEILPSLRDGAASNRPYAFARRTSGDRGKTACQRRRASALRSRKRTAPARDACEAAARRIMSSS